MGNNYSVESKYTGSKWTYINKQVYYDGQPWPSRKSRFTQVDDQDIGSKGSTRGQKEGENILPDKPVRTSTKACYVKMKTMKIPSEVSCWKIQGEDIRACYRRGRPLKRKLTDLTFNPRAKKTREQVDITIPGTCKSREEVNINPRTKNNTEMHDLINHSTKKIREQVDSPNETRDQVFLSPSTNRTVDLDYLTKISINNTDKELADFPLSLSTEVNRELDNPNPVSNNNMEPDEFTQINMKRKVDDTTLIPGKSKNLDDFVLTDKNSNPQDFTSAPTPNKNRERCQPISVPTASRAKDVIQHAAVKGKAIPVKEATAAAKEAVAETATTSNDEGSSSSSDESSCVSDDTDDDYYDEFGDFIPPHLRVDSGAKKKKATLEVRKEFNNPFDSYPDMLSGPFDASSSSSDRFQTFSENRGQKNTDTTFSHVAFQSQSVMKTEPELPTPGDTVSSIQVKEEPTDIINEGDEDGDVIIIPYNSKCFTVKKLSEKEQFYDKIREKIRERKMDIEKLKSYFPEEELVVGAMKFILNEYQVAMKKFRTRLSVEIQHMLMVQYMKHRVKQLENEKKKKEAMKLANLQFKIKKEPQEYQNNN